MQVDVTCFRIVNFCVKKTAASPPGPTLLDTKQGTGGRDSTPPARPYIILYKATFFANFLVAAALS